MSPVLVLGLCCGGLLTLLALLPTPVQLWQEATNLNALGALLGVLALWAAGAWTVLVMCCVLTYRYSRGMRARTLILRLAPGKAGRVLLIAVSAGLAFSSASCGGSAAGAVVAAIDWPATVAMATDWPVTAPVDQLAVATGLAPTSDSTAPTPTWTLPEVGIPTPTSNDANPTNPTAPAETGTPAGPEYDGNPANPATVTVTAGDSLWTITARHLATDDPRLIDTAWRALYAANTAVIGADPNLIQPGQHLVLPDSFPSSPRSGA